MRKVVFLVSSVLALLFVLSFTASQSSNEIQARIEDRGSNFEMECIGESCTTTIYSYDKYFNREGLWEEVDESWHACENNYCTNDYHFRAVAEQDGLVTAYLGDEELSQRLSLFNNLNLTFSSPTIDGSVLTYSDILPNIDLRYQYLPHKIKEEIIIHEPIRATEDIEVDFEVNNNNEDFALEKPFICDSNNYCKPINYTINSNHISLIIPSSFLNEPSLQYPIIIDPSFSLGRSSIIWNGQVSEYFDGDFLIYFRTSNPSSLAIGTVSSTTKSRADIDWNLVQIPYSGTIDNATLRLYIEKFNGPNYINITHMGKNSSQWPDTLDGNTQFYNDAKNGTIYSNFSSSTSSTNFYYNFTFNQQALSDLNNAFSTTKRFSTGIDTSLTNNATISARDHVNASQRPALIIYHNRYDYNLTYDANGNMVQGFGKYLEYDSWNRLSRIRNTNSTGTILADYSYDHEGQRIKKIVYGVGETVHNETTYYMNTRPADFIQVVNTNGTIINETYIYLQDKLIAKIDTQGRKFFYHPDHLGSTSLVTNESGAVVEDLLYLPYGDVLSGDELSRFTYTGQESDSESGFMDYGARQYNPQFGRFLQPDPIIADIYDPQNLNRYSYVLNNPYKYTDPTGKDAFLVGPQLTLGTPYLGILGSSFGAGTGGILGASLAISTSDSGRRQLGLALTSGGGLYYGDKIGLDIASAYPGTQTLSELEGESLSLTLGGGTGLTGSISQEIGKISESGKVEIQNGQSSVNVGAGVGLAGSLFATKTKIFVLYDSEKDKKSEDVYQSKVNDKKTNQDSLPMSYYNKNSQLSNTPKNNRPNRPSGGAWGWNPETGWWRVRGT